MARRGRKDAGGAPFLRGVHSQEGAAQDGRFPFNIPAFRQGIDIEITAPVTFLVGENGSGKSTLLEAIAELCGFNLQGGSRNHRFGDEEARSEIAGALRLSWRPKVTEGFFLRAESFFDFANYIDALALDGPTIYDAYGGRSLHAQSHGESFLALFQHRLRRGLCILDEPEAALSPQRQLSLLRMIHERAGSGYSQFLIATHSPILMACPGAEILSLDGDAIRPVRYEDTDHYRVTNNFLNHREAFLRRLLDDESGD